MAEIRFSNVKKVYSSKTVGALVDDVTISDGDFTVVLGASGSGKTALSRIICGLDEITEGEISIDGKVINDLQPKDRDLALVIKSVGVLDNLSVFENLSYGLKLRKMAKDEIEERTQEVARILGLTEVLSRKPKNISAIERQRVCIGRAFARKPKLIILDDPFSDFGDEARATLCEDIYKLQKMSKINFLYLTKKPEEALALADKIIVLEKGNVVSYGTPQEIYDAPSTLSVARMVGEPPINLFIGKVCDEDGLKFVSDTFTIALSDDLKERLAAYIGTDKKVQLAVRAEDLLSGNDIKGKIEAVKDSGDNKFAAFSVEGDQSAHYALVDGDVEIGEVKGFTVDTDRVNLYDLETEKIL